MWKAVVGSVMVLMETLFIYYVFFVVYNGKILLADFSSLWNWIITYSVHRSSWEFFIQWKKYRICSFRHFQLSVCKWCGIIDFDAVKSLLKLKDGWFLWLLLMLIIKYTVAAALKWIDVLCHCCKHTRRKHLKGVGNRAESHSQW